LTIRDSIMDSRVRRVIATKDELHGMMDPCIRDPAEAVSAKEEAITVLSSLAGALRPGYFAALVAEQQSDLWNAHLTQLLGITRPLLEVWRCRAKRAVSLLSISPVTKWKRLPRTRRALVAYEEAMAFVYACIETMPRDVYRQRAMELADDV